MKHCLSEEQAARYVEGRTTDVESREVAAHLEACPACRALLDSLALIYDLDAVGLLKDSDLHLVLRCVWNGYSLERWRKSGHARAAEELVMRGVQNITALVEHNAYPAVYIQRITKEILLRFTPPHPIGIEIETGEGRQLLQIPSDGMLRFPFSAPAGRLEVVDMAVTGSAEESLSFDFKVIPE